MTSTTSKHPSLLATAELNFSMHFGQAYEHGLAQFVMSELAKSRGLFCTNVKYFASITPKKNKDADALAQCVEWRDRIG